MVNDLLKKGMAVFVSGDLRTREFVGNDGQKRFSLDVTMDEMQILTPKGALDDQPEFGSGSGTHRTHRQEAGERRPPPVDDFGEDSDIPFSGVTRTPPVVRPGAAGGYSGRCDQIQRATRRTQCPFIRSPSSSSPR